MTSKLLLKLHQSGCQLQAPFYPQCEQEPQIAKTLSLRQKLNPNLKGAIHHFVAHYGLRPKVAHGFQLFHSQLQAALVHA